MDNADILELLKHRESAGTGEEGRRSKNIVKFLIFLLEERRLAVPADLIREIVLDLPLFYVPAYVRGFINRHGEPYTVIDLRVIFDQKLIESSTYLVLSDGANPAAFLISDVVEIMRVDEEDVHHITAHDEGMQYVTGSITDPEGREILILDISEVFKRLSKDVVS